MRVLMLVSVTEMPLGRGLEGGQVYDLPTESARGYLERGLARAVPVEPIELERADPTTPEVSEPVPDRVATGRKAKHK